MSEPEIVWRGVRYWVSKPKDNQHIGWNNWFVPYAVIKKTAKRVTLRGDLAAFKAFGDATGYPVDKADIVLDRARYEIDDKIYHSRIHEWFYKVKPAVDPERPNEERYKRRFHSADEFARYYAESGGVSPLSVLGLPQSATKADIKRAYKRLARKAHPDGGGSHEAFLKLNQAYESAMRLAR